MLRTRRAPLRGESGQSASERESEREGESQGDGMGASEERGGGGEGAESWP
jgi:hypothetical protein